MPHQGMAVELPLVYRRSFSAKNFLVDNSAKEIIGIELLAIIATYNLGLQLSPHQNHIAGSQELLFISFLHSLITILTNLGLGNYSLTKRFRLSTILISGTLAQLGAFFLSIAITYLGFYSTFGRLSVTYGAGAALAGVLLYKLLLRRHILLNPYIISTMGNGELISKIHERCSREHLGFRCLPLDIKTASITHLIAAIQESRSKTVILSSTLVHQPYFVDFSIAAAELDITVVDDLEFYTYLFEHIPIDFINKRWLFHMGLLRPSNLYLAGKRLFDLAFSISCLIVFLPIILLISLAIKSTSKGPVFFVQQRIGQYSKIFNVYKFRTMKYTPNREVSGSLVTSKNDQRVTMVGKIIRPLHLDELPQLINIIKGEMSLIGVRPESIVYGQRMQQEISVYHLRDLFRPGITGHAQLSMHYPMHTLTDTKNKLGYDFYYLMNQGAVLDLVIICKTFFKFFLQ